MTLRATIAPRTPRVSPTSPCGRSVSRPAQLRTARHDRGRQTPCRASTFANVNRRPPLRCDTTSDDRRPKLSQSAGEHMRKTLPGYVARPIGARPSRSRPRSDRPNWPPHDRTRLDSAEPGHCIVRLPGSRRSSHRRRISTPSSGKTHHRRATEHLQPHAAVARMRRTRVAHASNCLLRSRAEITASISSGVL